MMEFPMSMEDSFDQELFRDLLFDNGVEWLKDLFWWENAHQGFEYWCGVISDPEGVREEDKQYILGFLRCNGLIEEQELWAS